MFDAPHPLQTLNSVSFSKTQNLNLFGFSRTSATKAASILPQSPLIRLKTKWLYPYNKYHHFFFCNKSPTVKALFSQINKFSL